jgi:hypothetical protein
MFGVKACEIRILGGDSKMASGVTYYLNSASPDLGPQKRLSGNLNLELEDGIALVCPAWNQPCLDAVESFRRLSGGKRWQLAVQRSFLGVKGSATLYGVVIVPSRNRALRDQPQ